MFANFKKAFKKDEKTYKIPKAILESMSDNLPEGFEYVQVGRKTCAIKSKSKKTNIKVKLKLGDRVNIKTPEELLEYLYRSQKEVEIDSNIIELDNVKFNINDLVKMPFSSDEFDEKNIKLILKPKPFPKPIPLIIGYGDKNIEMNFQRQPYPDLHKSLFKSIDGKSLVISYMIDEISKSITVNITINIGEAKSVEEITIISEIYKCFKMGKSKIADIKLNRGFDNANEESGLDSSIQFWNKVNLLSKELGILFNPQKEIKKSDINLVEKLYKSFIEKKPYKEFINIDGIEVTCSRELDNSSMLNKDGIVLDFTSNNEYKLLGQKLNLFDYVMWCNLKIKDIVLIDKKNYKYKFIIDEKSSNKIFQVIRHFKSIEEIEIYRESLSRNVNDLEKIEILE